MPPEETPLQRNTGYYESGRRQVFDALAELLGVQDNERVRARIDLLTTNSTSRGVLCTILEAAQEASSGGGDDLLAIGEIVTITGAARGTVDSAMRFGRLPVAQRNGNRRLVRRSDVEAWRAPASPTERPAQPPE